MGGGEMHIVANRATNVLPVREWRSVCRGSSAELHYLPSVILIFAIVRAVSRSEVGTRVIEGPIGKKWQVPPINPQSRIKDQLSACYGAGILFF